MNQLFLMAKTIIKTSKDKTGAGANGSSCTQNALSGRFTIATAVSSATLVIAMAASLIAAPVASAQSVSVPPATAQNSQEWNEESIRTTYQKIKSESVAVQGISADFFNDVIARRFINRADWESYISQNKHNPRCVYSPKPQTWDNWIETTVNDVSSAVKEKRALTVDLLKEWNRSALTKTLPDFIDIGELKHHMNYGKNVERRDALTKKEIAELQAIYFPAADGANAAAALSWMPLTCKEDINIKNMKIPYKVSRRDCWDIYKHAKKKASTSKDKVSRMTPEQKEDYDFWVRTVKDMDQGLLFDRWYWYACWPAPTAQELAKQDKQCGMIKYADPSKAPTILQSILDNVNQYVATSTNAQSSSEASREDVISFALKTQRQVVALHPFNKGNGRVSRWVMDYITESQNLPPILIKDMNRDLTTPWQEYLANGRAGMQESVSRMQQCMQVVKSVGVSQAKNSVCGVSPYSIERAQNQTECDDVNNQ